ncbi:MAG: ADP-ribosylation factor-like protein [Candidatus Heimdallarchaeaceae archaeon]
MSYLFDELSGKGEAKDTVEDKILLMGLQAAGKTAIKDVVFFQKKPDEVEDYMATVHYQRQFIDEEQKSMIIDSGGQESYWNEAVTHFRHLVFSNVKLLVWIVDVTKPELFEESERRFSFTIRQYKKENPDGKITVLCHKVDLVTPEKMIVIHQHIRDMFSEGKYEVDFENTSIYYSDSLRELLFTIMEEAGINTKRFELISNLGQKVEESDEFQSYVMEHEEDPRVLQLRDYLNPEPEALLPSFGKLSMQVDLKEYDIIEIVLIDKETNSPIVGASSQANVNAENSMEYLIGLHDFKNRIKENGGNFDPTGTVLTSSTGKVHAMIFSLDANYLLITSFTPITDERKELLYELILRFAQSTAADAKPAAPSVPTTQPEPTPEPVAQPAPPVEQPTPKPAVTTEEVAVAKTEVETEAPKAKPIKIEEIITSEEKDAGFFEPAVMGDEFLGEEKPIAIPEPPKSTKVVEPEVVPEPAKEAEEDVVPEPPKVELEPAPVEITQAEVHEIVSEAVSSEREVKIEEPAQAVVPPAPEPAKVVEEPAASVDAGDDMTISFSADDIKNFANFLVQKKETILDEAVTVDDIKSMSNFLFKGITEEEEQPNEESTD